ncbi:MAG: (Na+)-NQR maturation NqrM [Gammaproteobacteria bacterium]|jgi:hypothetical protein|nr:(Na+)-NQR maturation NqrM [Gammaproteobacteria bacterium]MBT3858706.1 (Na+)-NQR maturation NqrM [Gammaproteobacteria bacterium]MBT3986058.1 (Na+)-NQR maturation NqrM [Gammaproteobacteria bacterium]MBT4254458.1 (Na+)-NQR maturation NqrM [Gammaproteobacteria bacterium]MBT4580769.1 (Na+)-NQR maturation NqrM [Gammaproteobacteria bacterium]
MTTVLFTFALMAGVILIMSVGVLFGRKPVQGSCGGLNNIGGLNECELCGGDLKKCDQESNDTMFINADENNRS